MTESDLDSRIAWAQIWLAFFYGVQFVGIFAFMVWFWASLTKFDSALLSVFATNAMNQTKDASNFFFARHRAQSADNGDANPPLVPNPSTQESPK